MAAAPLAHFDEDWQDFNEFKESSAQLDAGGSAAAAGGLDDLSDLDNSFSGEICSFQSMEDLVHDFDEKLTVCFRNYNTTTEHIAPIKPITEDNYLKDDEVWNTLTDNYGNVMPVDWKTSHTRSLHLPTLNLNERQKLDNQSLDLSDDEELREQMDMHSIIVSCINDEPLVTAEQVIEEIEEMMQESPDPEDDESPSHSDLSMLSQDLHGLKRSGSDTSYEERLRQLSVSELSETLEEVETAIRRYSEELIQALALRDELEYEKEVKNSFISLLIDVQNRQKEHRELLRKKKKIRSATLPGPNGHRSANTHVPGTRLTLEGLSNVIQNGLRQTFGTTGGDKKYLTTVIPYEKKMGSPAVEDLQILTKILHAMRDDSEKVPALLTDYILKALV
ncbi:fasciculation and elongation protein zeta-2 isoform X4 [Phyllopteryx taeniolatus]|uniref:fasciculation and elongation protein zeta-2 isoform X4 n=1 Tax=Phyllopteryx taeniolatus TaxID=161469 RepID=UPI002AD5A70F|nr:fasciculation and elongation protein zeta-2 isoform X4 [Phyllopteryx taeniolatus]XP_061610134.1 fasciculation and elongation protein zeta-2 isoform X4 [Phyllopteryx taeniolatus]